MKGRHIFAKGAFAIKPGNERPYATFELLLLNILREGPCSTEDLVRRAYEADKQPKTAPNALNYRLRRLQQKVYDNSEDFELRHSERTGGAVRLTWWLEPKERTL
jgi:hypothetical protein